MYSWLAENIFPEGKLDTSFPISANLAMELEFFYVGLGLLQPRIYSLAKSDRPPVVINSDAQYGPRQRTMVKQRPGRNSLVRRQGGRSRYRCAR